MTTLIEQKRKELNMTQEKLAQLTGISRSQIANIETGISKVSFESARALARALNLRWEEVYESLYCQGNSTDAED